MEDELSQYSHDKSELEDSGNLCEQRRRLALRVFLAKWSLWRIDSAIWVSNQHFVVYRRKLDHSNSLASSQGGFDAKARGLASWAYIPIVIF